MITKRTLEKWRREALHNNYEMEMMLPEEHGIDGASAKEMYKRILTLTGELLDQHLLNKEKSK